MALIFNGRFTAKPSENFVLFLIGMRINRWWMLHKWLPMILAMPRMLKRLRAEPKLGMIHSEGFFRLFPLTTCMVSYWRDFESLENFAKSASEPHLVPWGRYMKKVGADGSVGVWHETYQIEKTRTESIYGNMPKFGLGAAFPHVAINPNNTTARQRIQI